MEKHRMKVLDLLSKGKITVQDAERLLDHLNPGSLGGSRNRRTSESLSTEGTGKGGKRDAPSSSKTPHRSKKTLSHLRIIARCCDGHKANIRIPISFVCSGAPLDALLPDEVLRTLGRLGVDLAGLQANGKDGHGGRFAEALSELDINIKSNDGSVVKIFCE